MRAGGRSGETARSGDDGHSMTAAKLAIFVVGALASYPVGRWLERHPAWRLRAWVLVGFLPFFSRADMGILYWNRPGDTNGIEVALLDWLALSLLFAARRRAGATPYRIVMGAYLAVALGAVTYSEWSLGAFGYVWKLGRMYLLYAAVCRASQDDAVPAAILRGVMYGLVYEALWTVWQHFGQGILRAPGTFAHENTLGMLVNLTVMVPIALIFAGRATRLGWLAVIAALPSCLFTVSRGTILFFAVGTVAVYVVSVLKKYDARKAKLGLVGIALAAAFIPLAITSLASRSTAERSESMLVRGQFERAASLMLEDHPLGVGPNHFGIMLLSGGYGDRAGLDWTQRMSIVHNVYWLTAAEMGYAGVLALVALFLAPLLSSIRWIYRARQDPRADVLLGLAVGLALFYVHSFFEWTWRITEVSYVYWMVVGMTGGLARQLRDARLGRSVSSRRPFTVTSRGLRPEAAGGLANP